MATYTRDVVTTVAYLIGIRKSILQNTYADEIENLEELGEWVGEKETGTDRKVRFVPIVEVR